MRSLLLAFIVAVTYPLAATAAEFERRLIPVTVSASSGAGGSRWSTEVFSLHEDGGAVVGGLHYDPLWVIVPFRPFSAPFIASEPGEPPGTIVYIDEPHSGMVHIAATVRDLSKPETPATALPVVRHSEFSSSGVTLLGVPHTPFRMRTTLRIYSLDIDAQVAEARVVVSRHDFADPTPLLDIVVPLVAWQRETVQFQLRFRYRPLAAELSLDRVLGTFSAGNYSIRVTPAQPGLRLWALASTTVSETGEVRIISPE